MNRRKWLKKIPSQSSKIACPCSQQLHKQVKFSLDKDVFIFLNYCCWVCKHTKVCIVFQLREAVRSLQSFQKVSAYSFPCPHRKRLCRHCVCVVNNYFNMCRRSQLLSRHTIFENIKLNFVLLFS